MLSPWGTTVVVVTPAATILPSAWRAMAEAASALALSFRPLKLVVTLPLEPNVVSSWPLAYPLVRVPRGCVIAIPPLPKEVSMAPAASMQRPSSPSSRVRQEDAGRRRPLVDGRAETVPDLIDIHMVYLRI